MIILARPLIALLAATGLSACTPTGYVSAPAVAEYFRELAPTARYDGVALVSLCRDDNGGEAVSVLLEDGQHYDYLIPADGGQPQLRHQSTEKHRKFGQEQGYTVSLGCIGYYEGQAPFMTLRGEYRFHVGKLPATSTAEVDEQIVHNMPFSDDVKARLQRAARAADDAAARGKKFVPAESTWGL